MHRYLIFIFLFIIKLSFCQTQINWEDLEDVQFSDMYIDSIGEYVLYPYFGPSVKKIHDKKVSISGYILALDPDNGYYVLSKGPFASCFFCGAGGPETVIELSLKSVNDSFFMDQFANITGVLKLNADDIYRCVYILENAQAK